MRAGYAAYYWIQDSIVSWPDHPYPGLTLGTPILNLRSYTIGMAHNFSHEDERQSTYSFRDNLDALVRQGRSARPEDRRRGLLPEEPGVPLHPLPGDLRRDGRADPGRTSSRSSPCGTTSRRWNLAALSPIVAELHARRRRHAGAGAAQRRRRLDSGRLAGRVAAHAQSRCALRPRGRRVRRGRRDASRSCRAAARTTRTTGDRGSAPRSR